MRRRYADFEQGMGLRVPLEESCEWIKMDFLIEKGDHYGWAELKCLNINYGQFPFMISYKKIEAAKQLYETSGKKFTLIFRCKDALCFHTWDFSKDYKFELGGRTRVQPATRRI